MTPYRFLTEFWLLGIPSGVLIGKYTDVCGKVLEVYIQYVVLHSGNVLKQVFKDFLCKALLLRVKVGEPPEFRSSNVTQRAMWNALLKR